MRIIFLGILLDGEFHILAIPEDKCIKAVNMLREVLAQKTITVKDLQKLTGTLNSLCRAIFPGRAFLRQMYDRMITESGIELKGYHHIRVNADLKEDCRMWLKFLTTKPAETVLCRPFVDLEMIETSETLNFYTDSLANEDLGFGCVFNECWFFGRWEPGFIKAC